MIVQGADACSILGGAYNSIAVNSDGSSIVGGFGNSIWDSHCSVIFGKENITSGLCPGFGEEQHNTVMHVP